MTPPAVRIWAVPGLLLLSVVAARNRLESDMALHMLVEFPILVGVGWLFASSAGERLRARIAPFNVQGLSGLLYALSVSALWMIPRALDATQVDPWIELGKFVSLLGAGAALQLSWTRAGTVVQAFALLHWAWMTASVGMLYQDTDVRLCNFYLTDQQALSGTGLVGLAGLALVVWCASVGIDIVRAEAVCESSAVH